MGRMKKILIIFTLLLFNVILVEAGVYLWYRPLQLINPSTTSNVAKTVKRVSSISKEQIDVINRFNAGTKNYLPLAYDEEKERVYLDITPKAFIYMFSQMGVSYSAWAALSTYTKDQIDSIVLTNRLKGTVYYLDTDRKIDGKSYLYFVLRGKDGMESAFLENQSVLSKTKFVKLVGGKEVPLDWRTELKNGDSIVMEATADLTKHTSDPAMLIEGKFTKL